MDPNAAVIAIMEIMADATEYARNGMDAQARRKWSEAHQLMNDLVEWINKGGFPPSVPFAFQA